jgi:tetratricopeptide (TPR) repeat protein
VTGRRAIAAALPAVLSMAMAMSGCADSTPRDDAGGDAAATRSATVPVDLSILPDLDVSGMETRVAQAISLARQRVVANPSSGEAWGHYGVVLDAHDLVSDAIPCYRQARAMAPDEFRWAYFLGRALEIGGGEAGEAAALCRTATELRPGYAPAHVRPADLLVREAQPDSALAEYRKAIELDPMLGHAYRGVGQTLLSLKRVDEAVAPLERAAALLPEDGATLASLARAYARTGRRDEGRRAAERSRELEQIHVYDDPVLAEIGAEGVSATICFRRGREFVDQGRYREAIPNLEIAAESLGDNAHVFTRLGLCYLQTGQRDKAMQALQTALRLDDTFPDVHAQVGGILAAQGNFAEAIAHYRRSLELRPGDGKTAALLASSLAQSGDVEGALRQFTKAAQLGPLDAQDENNWGITLARAGHSSLAAEHFQAAIRLEPTFQNALFNLGIAFEDMDLPDEAIARYEEVVRLNPRHRAAARLQALRAGK